MRREDLSGGVRESLVRLPPPHEAHYGVVPLPCPQQMPAMGALQAEHNRAEAAFAQVDLLASAMTDSFPITRVLSRREAVSSSAMEGTHSTLDALLTVEDAEAEGGAADRQVRDYALALMAELPRVRDAGCEALDTALVQRLHARAMAEDAGYRHVPGALRDTVVWIGGAGSSPATSTFNPPPPALVPQCLADVMDYMQAREMQRMQQSLVARLAIGHAQFEAVHPFPDGNGRVGRLLLPLTMAAEGHVPLYLSPYLAANKPGYFAALKEAQQRAHWVPIIGFFADAVNATLAEVLSVQQRLTALRQDWLTRRRFRRGSAALRALPLLMEHPIVNIARLATLLGVAYSSAADAVADLVEAGILTERTGYARNRVFAAEEALSLYR